MSDQDTVSAIRRFALFLGNGFRVANVMWNRALGRPPRYMPILLMFLTKRCNLRCKMCGVCEYDPTCDDQPELDTGEWKSVLQSARNLGCTIVSMTGGEPLLRKDVFDLIRFARELGMAVHLCSNGMLLDRDNVIQLREAGVNALSISIESPGPEPHDSLRGPRSFELAVQGVKLARELAPEVQVGINCVITRLNYKNIAAMIPFAEEIGAHQIKFAPIHTNLLHRRKRIEHYSDLIFSQEDLDELDYEIKELIAASRRSRILTTSAMFFAGMADLYRKPLQFRCYAGYAACAINPAGIVAPCCDMDGTLSVRDQPLETIWGSPEMERMRTKVRHCNRACWDTTNTELSLRLRPASIIRDLIKTWRDVGFYFTVKKE
ncbi:MAG TPA: radical SAM protein [Candidatus Hydrogenedentes bacterium]|nr:radical SAM protein [Candidatus Hydrogenedentota bacterium]HRT21814.1 radical SAM protein [Candidatus Hydrogenedentota bacterium]HRT63272.1 radical SAM protein [Candidatus Hydrogenedentota bacterium]